MSTIRGQPHMYRANNAEKKPGANMRLIKVAAAALAPLTIAAITTATAASASAAMPPTAGFGLQQPLDDPGPGGPDTGPSPNFWNGGDPGGGTGPASAGTGSNSEPGYWNGGEAGGGTGPADSGPDTGSGPGIWNPGEAGGSV